MTTSPEIDSEWDEIEKQRDVQERFTVITGDQIEMKRTEWWLENMIPAHTLTILGGFGSVGKSSVAAHWAADEIRSGGRVLWIHSEGDRSRTIIPQFKALDADDSQVVFIEAEGGIEFPADLPSLDYTVEQHGITMIVMDALTSFAPDGMNNNAAREVRKYLEPLIQWAEKREIPVLGIAHLNKGPGSAVHKISGTTAWTDVPRMALVFARDEQTDECVISVVKANLGSGRRNLGYRIESATVGDGITVGRVVMLGDVDRTADEVMASNDSARDGRGDTGNARGWLSRFLKNGPQDSSNIYAVAQQAGFSKKQVQTARDGLGIEWKRMPSNSVWWRFPDHDWPNL